MKIHIKPTKAILETLDVIGKKIGELTMEELQTRLYYTNRAYKRRGILIQRIQDLTHKEL